MDNYEAAWKALKLSFLDKHDTENYDRMCLYETVFYNSDMFKCLRPALSELNKKRG